MMKFFSSKIGISKIFFIVSYILFFIPCIFTFLIKKGYVRAVVLLMALVLGMIGIMLSKRIEINKRKIFFIVVFFILFIISLFNNKRNSDGEFSKSIIYFFGVIYSSFVVMNESYEDDKLLLRVILILLFIHIIFGIYFLYNPNVLIELSYKIFNLSDYYMKFFEDNVKSGYFMGITSHYSTSGIYMSIATIITSICFFYDKFYLKKCQLFNLFIFIISFICLILTAKRGHLLFTIIAICCVVYFGCILGTKRKKINQILIYSFIFFIILLICMFIPAFQKTISRFVVFGNLNSISNNRIDELWFPAIKYFLEEPFFGIGWENFSKIHIVSVFNNELMYYAVHNIYIQLLCETGIIGFMIYMFAFIYVLCITYKNLIICKKRNSKVSLIILFSFTYQVFFLLYGMTGNPLYDVQCLYPYLISCAMGVKYQSSICAI